MDTKFFPPQFEGAHHSRHPLRETRLVTWWLKIILSYSSNVLLACPGSRLLCDGTKLSALCVPLNKVEREFVAQL